MNSWLTDFRTPARSRILSFWGPVGIALGVTCILNVFIVTESSINFEPVNGSTTFIAGIILMILGIIMSSLAQDKVILARVGITGGLSIFFWGIHVVNVLKSSLGFGIGWGTIILGIIFLIVGFVWAPK